MKHHKGRALEDECLCSKCPLRFECFTQERIFSNPIFQGLFEALTAKGYDREEALDLVSQEIKSRIGHYPTQIPHDQYNPWRIYAPETTWWGSDSGVTLTDSNVDVNGTYTVTYQMLNGEEISWSAKPCELNNAW